MNEKTRVIILEEDDGHEESIIPLARRNLEKKSLATVVIAKELEELLHLLEECKDSPVKTWLVYHLGISLHPKAIKERFPK